MEANVYLISLTGISAVFILLSALYFIMKAFKYLPSAEKANEKNKAIKMKKQKASEFKGESSHEDAAGFIEDQNIIAVITAVMAEKNISQDRISIKKLGGL